MFFRTFEILLVALCCLAGAFRGVHIFQLNRYQLTSYQRWLRVNGDRFLKGHVLIGFVGTVAKLYLPVLLSLFIAVESTRSAVASWMTLVLFALATAGYAYLEHYAPAAKPFGLTHRVCRLLAATLAVDLLAVLLLALVGIPVYFAFALAPYTVLVSGKIMDPIETRINARFYEEARRKIRARHDLTVIGITGSFGKTLTKFMLREMLSTQYKVLATPASFNTPMGISRVINDQLTEEHQVFIAEMGAQHKGDIKHLVKLVNPKYGLITVIGDQHLKTFGSLANAAQTKYELVEGLPQDGAAFFGTSGQYIDRLYVVCGKEKYRAGVNGAETDYMRASEISFDAKGTRFMLECEDGGRIWCRTRLLGSYNVQNLALAAAVARRMGLTMEEIGAAIERMQTFEKKLQLIPGERVVIDDSLNRVPDGAVEALKVLEAFPGRRILVTPGLSVEDRPEKADEVNFAFGTQVGGRADFVILVGEKKNLQPIYRGIMSVRFPKNAVRFVADMEDAEDVLNEISGKGDSVLYESTVE